MEGGDLMEFRTDLVSSVPQYGNKSYGLLTLGEFKNIRLENGKKLNYYHF